MNRLATPPRLPGIVGVEIRLALDDGTERILTTGPVMGVAFERDDYTSDITIQGVHEYELTELSISTPRREIA